LTIRSNIISEWSIHEAGLWESVNNISNLVMTTITTSLVVYYLPRLSEIKKESEIRNEIISTGKFILPIMLLISIFFLIGKNQIMQMLYTKEFLKAGDYLFIQFVGNIFKVSGWLFAYILIIKKMTSQYLILEVGFTAIYIFLSMVLINYNGAVGAVYSYTIAYFFYLIGVFFLINSKLDFI